MNMTKVEKIVAQMLEKDTYSQWLGVEVVELREGFAQIKMTVREEMLNGMGIMHGGISFSLADSAFAFASNSHGQKAVSIETSINHTKAVFLNDEIVATAEVETISRSVGFYIVRVTRGEELVGLFKGVVFRKQEEWDV
ncbi:MAG: thioesterase [Crocinitomicaceae bacterium]|nr:thioesterase [Crocinitomicaceae bacterium]